MKSKICGAAAMLGLVAYGTHAAAAEPAPIPNLPAYESEIAAIAANGNVEKAFDFFVAEDDRNVRDLIELTEIPAPPFEESARAARFAEMLRDAGLDDVSTDEVGNVIARRPGLKRDRAVALVAHLDTVFPPETDVSVRREGDRLTAPGVGDNTRGLVMVLSIARAMEKFALETDADILFIGSVGEEGLGDLRGVKHLFREGGPKIDSFIAVDGGDNERVVHRAVGSHRYRVSFKGPGGHSWGAFGTANPHHAQARAVSLFAEKAAPVVSSGAKTTFSVGRIGGGTSVNSIPFDSWFEVDMRSGDQTKLDEIDVVLHQAVGAALDAENKARKRGESLTVSIEPVGKRPAGSTPPEAPLVGRAAAALKAVGLDIELTESSTDSNIAMAMGIPAITISRGGESGESHSPDEWWENKDSHLALQSGLLLLLAEAGLAE